MTMLSDFRATFLPICGVEHEICSCVAELHFQ